MIGNFGRRGLRIQTSIRRRSASAQKISCSNIQRAMTMIRFSLFLNNGCEGIRIERETGYYIIRLSRACLVHEDVHTSFTITTGDTYLTQ